MKMWYFILYFAINIPLGYIGVALSNYYERKILENQGKKFLSWLPEYIKELKEVVRGKLDTSEEVRVGGKVIGKKAVSGDRSVFVAIIPFALGGWMIFLSSFSHKNKRQ